MRLILYIFFILFIPMELLAQVALYHRKDVFGFFRALYYFSPPKQILLQCYSHLNPIQKQEKVIWQHLLHNVIICTNT